VRWLIGAHDHDGVTWFGREHYLRLIWWMSLADLMAAAHPKPDLARTRAIGERIAELAREAEASGYRLDRMLAPPPSRRGA